MDKACHISVSHTPKIIAILGEFSIVSHDVRNISWLVLSGRDGLIHYNIKCPTSGTIVGPLRWILIRVVVMLASGWTVVKMTAFNTPRGTRYSHNDDLSAPHVDVMICKRFPHNLYFAKNPTVTSVFPSQIDSNVEFWWLCSWPTNCRTNSRVAADLGRHDSRATSL